MNKNGAINQRVDFIDVNIFLTKFQELNGLKWKKFAKNVIGVGLLDLFLRNGKPHNHHLTLFGVLLNDPRV